ncbi:MAG: DNA polymerase III subunit alpha [bacterium]
MASKFTHLHTHSHYSLLNALPKIDELVKTAKKMGITSLALTDNGNLYGAIEFYKECQKQEIKPIIGIDAYVAYRSRHDKQTGVDKDRFRLVLLAVDQIGYKNLIKLVTYSHIEGFYYKPRLDRELLEKYKEGLIAISPSFAGDVVKSLTLRDKEKALEKVEWYKKTFGSENFFLEITHHPEIKGHEEKMKNLVDFARETNINIMAAHDVYYLDPADRLARETLMAVQNNADISDKMSSGDTEDFSFISPEKAEEFFASLPDALQNTEKIAERCNLALTLGKWLFPQYIVESGLSADDELRKITEEGIAKRGVPDTPETRERMNYELKVIGDKGYAPYFLVVSDLLRFAREKGILSNIRGSVSGSLVTYLSGITNINPIEYEIPFERFLNPDRPSAPDIDMDFADDRRDEMIEYAREKYGADKVAQIGTFGTMAARGSVRDVTRAMGLPYGVGDSIAKLIPMGSQGFPMTIDKAMEDVEELKERYKNEPDVKKIIDMAKKIEGCARHMGVHAAGVVISPMPLTDIVPLQYDPKGEGKIITQYDMYSVDENNAGLLKFDFLGLKNLSIIADTINLIKHTTGVVVDPDTMPINDKKTFQMLAKGDTTDLFQLNGEGMTKFLVDLKPNTIHDINAMVALYRPGPIQFIPDYIKRKHNPKLITYLDPALEPILKKTNGILVYQDDLLMMAHKLAGYTWGEVDKFRKAVGKKIPEEMEKQKEKFINGCVEHSGWPLRKAQEIWGWIEPFASYGFNKAHSVSYGRVAYQTAYLKANFPAEYMASVLTHEAGDVDKVAESIAECKRIGISILPPDINESFKDFTVIKSTGDGKADAIRFGLKTIKNFGEGIADSIIAERKKNGPFTSLSEFLTRVTDKNLNKKSLESLIKAGALDAFSDRHTLLHNLDRLLTFHKEESTKESAQDSLFSLFGGGGHSELALEKAPTSNPTDQLLWEKELLGLYISGHPLDSFKQKLATRDTDIKKIKERSKDKQTVVFGGIIEEMKDIVTKKGDKMLFLRVADMSDSIECVVFPKVLEEFQDVLIPEACIVIKGTFSTRNEGKSVIAEKIKALE